MFGSKNKKRIKELEEEVRLLKVQIPVRDKSTGKFIKRGAK